jgi:type II secretory pathway component GspD/PulD (secretin)
MVFTKLRYCQSNIPSFQYPITPASVALWPIGIHNKAIFYASKVLDFMISKPLFKKINNPVKTKPFLSGICLFLAVAMSWSGSQASEVAVIRVKYRWASEVLPIVQSMLSPHGTVTVSERVNSLIIVDNSDAIHRIRDYLDQYDQPLEQVRIHVRFIEKKSIAGEKTTARSKASRDHLRVATGGKKKDGFDRSIQDYNRRQTDEVEFFIFATSGQPAFIRAGQNIPYKSRWTDYARQYSGGGAVVRFQTLETGFEITPTTAGDLVHLKIVPRIAYGEGNEAVMRFYGAQTEVTTFYGQWVEIGGTGSHSNDVIREIISQGYQSTLNSMTMAVRVQRP